VHSRSACVSCSVEEPSYCACVSRSSCGYAGFVPR
jgi:hypothetical protein